VDRTSYETPHYVYVQDQDLPTWDSALWHPRDASSLLLMLFLHYHLPFY